MLSSIYCSVICFLAWWYGSGLVVSILCLCSSVGSVGGDGEGLFDEQCGVVSGLA